jgi:hypothetical protein
MTLAMVNVRSSGLAVVLCGSVHLSCHIKLQLELLSAQRNSLLLALIQFPITSNL